MNLFKLANVIYIPNSDTVFDALLESEFLAKFIEYLKMILGERFDDYQFFFFSAQPVNKLIQPNADSEKREKRKVLFFISEESGEYPQHLVKDFFAIFKSYLSNGQLPDKNVFPFPIGYVNGFKEQKINPVSERKYDVFFSGSLHSSRLPFYYELSRLKYFLPFRLLNKAASRFFRLRVLISKKLFYRQPAKWYVNFTSGFGKGLSKDEYGSMLYNSKIVVCPKGGINTECFRHYEAMRAGCVIISEKLPDTYFYEGSPIIQVNSWREGIAKAKSILKDKNLLDQLQTETIKWYNERCSEEGTARYVVNCLNSL